MNGKRAFTLVELLIVITIFIISLSLLTPLINKIRAKADVIKCSSNIRVISLALHMYAADHGEAFPAALGELYPAYIKEEKVFDCPATGAVGTAEKPDYEYVPGLTESAMPAEVILYDRDGNHKSLGRNIVRVNGSVEWAKSTEGKPK